LIDEAGLQYVFALQNGLYKGNGIPAANQDLSIEVHISGWEAHQNGENCGDEAF
jgi:hypothetical protein